MVLINTNKSPKIGPEIINVLAKENANPKDYVEIGVDAEDYYRIKNEGKNSAT